MARKSRSRTRDDTPSNLAPRPAYDPRVIASRRRRGLIDTFSDYQRIGRVNNSVADGSLVNHSRDVVDARNPERPPPEPLRRETCKQRPKDNRSKGGNSRRFIPYCTKKG
jgi:hypothetical protein